MKKKILLILLNAILLIATFIVGRQVGLNTEESKTQIITREEEVSTHDIKKTLTGSGSASAKTTEKLELDTSKDFEAMCVEEDDTVKAGSNILEYTDGTYLTAENDCVIISYNVPETEDDCTDSNYVEVSYLNTLTTSISINENEINNVAVDQEVEIILSADETKTYTGKITKIDSVGTYSTSGTTFSATVEFENDGNIKIGMSLSCTVILSQETGVASVPIDAVYENKDGQEYVVKVNSDGTTEEVIIETGVADENYVQVLSGIEIGDKVQIETEVTESTNTSSESGSSGFGNFGGGAGGLSGGEMPSGGDFDKSNFGGEMPSGGGQMPSGGMPGSK